MRERQEKGDKMKRKIALFLCSCVFLAGCGKQGKLGEEWLKKPKLGGGEAICLDEEIIRWGQDQVLKNIPRPIDPRIDDKPDNMYPSPLYDLCSPPSPNPCGGPEVADYSLVATDVRLGQIILGPDRLVAKQVSTSNSPLPEEYKDRIYRTFCGDWCYPASESEGYRGTFYCDFVFYLKSSDSNGNPLLGNPKDPNLPPDDALFDAYFRVGAQIPEKIRCKEGEAPQTFAEKKPQFFINFLETRWFFRDEGTVKLKDILPEKPQGEREFLGKLEIPEFGGVFEMYKNLFFRSGERIIYGIREGEMKETADPQRRITYKEFQKAEEWGPRGKTLQLGTFKPPISAGWVKSWLRESKPAIYLYPERPIQVSIKLNPFGNLVVTDPPYDPQKGWEIFVFPNGLVKSPDSGQIYPYLYYEADLRSVFIRPEGFVVKGIQMEEFLRRTLPQVGLNRRETEDFIQYWKQRLDEKQPYYFVHFLEREQIEELEPLEVDPQPESKIRIRLYFKPLQKPIDFRAQELKSPSERQGFVLVEWGGFLDED